MTSNDNPQSGKSSFFSRDFFRRLFNAQQSGLILVILLLGTILTLFADSHVDNATGLKVNDFLNRYTLAQTLTDASCFAIMAIGATLVIISGGIDLSVGSIYALSGIVMTLALRGFRAWWASRHGVETGDVDAYVFSPMMNFLMFLMGLGICLGVSLICGLLNGLLIVGLRVHPFIITLGAMWVYRGIAFVASGAQSILTPESLTNVIKAPLGFGEGLHPVPALAMLAAAILGGLYLSRTVMGRNIYALGGNAEACRFCGLRTSRILLGVYSISGLTAGVAAFLNVNYYGAASCADASGYELFVIASAVVGGASLSGGRGGAISAALGALLVQMIRQSIRTLHFNQNFEWIIIGCAIVAAVVLDQLTARMTARRLLLAHAETALRESNRASSA